MKILRWLLSHTFLILLIVLVIYGYMFWGNLLGNNTPAGKAIAYLSSEFVEVEEFVNAVKAKQAQLNSEKSSGDTSAKSTNTEVAVVAKEVKTDEVMPKIDVSKSPVNAKKLNTASDKKNTENSQLAKNNSNQGDVQKAAVAVKSVETGKTLTKSQKVEASNEAKLANHNIAVAKNISDGKFVSPEIERQLENVNHQGKVLSDSQRSEAVRSSWILARKSFYQRKYALSEQTYRKVIDGTEDNFDAFGELGNVYFNQGKKQLAATAYFEAAAILVRKGQIDRARSMVGLLNLLDKGKANELQQLIDGGLS